jgi:hypothetical protein
VPGRDFGLQQRKIKADGKNRFSSRLACGKIRKRVFAAIRLGRLKIKVTFFDAQKLFRLMGAGVRHIRPG